MELTLGVILFLSALSLVIVYLWLVSLQVVNARNKYNIQPPKISGNTEFEKVYRIQVNTFEASIIYMPLFTILFIVSNGFIAGGIIIFWLVARIIYQLGYSKDVKSRTIGFKMQQGIFVLSLILILIEIISFFK